jgi:hypothetical protein
MDLWWGKPAARRGGRIEQVFQQPPRLSSNYMESLFPNATGIQGNILHGVINRPAGRFI